MSDTQHQSDLPTPKYRIGQTVYTTERERKVKYHPCPDCLGTKLWPFKTPAGEEIVAECLRCGQRRAVRIGNQDVPGLAYEVYEFRVVAMTVGQVEAKSSADSWTEGDRVSYMCRETGIGSGSNWREGRLYATHDEAQAVAIMQSAEASQKAAVTPEAMRGEFYSTLEVGRAGRFAAWETTYHAWDKARQMREYLDDLVERKVIDGDDELYAYRDAIEERSWRREHPFEPVLAAARASSDPSVLAAVAEFDALLPPVAVPVAEDVL